jgi:tetratricopeptide (TPR) repeat protein
MLQHLAVFNAAPERDRKAMYLSGSKWNMRKKRRRSNPWRVLLLLALIGAVIYFNRVVVPTVPSLFSPTPTPTRSSTAYVAEAADYFEKGKLAQAEEAYLAAIAVNPQEPAFYIELARVQVFDGKYEEAEINARNALLLAPESPKAKAVLGWVLDFRASVTQDTVERERLLVDALDWVEKALEGDPNSALAHAYLAEVLLDSDLANFERARQAAETAVVLDPELMEAHRALGYVWELTSNYALAIDAYESALALNPNLAVLYISLGNLYQALETPDFDKAMEMYLDASALAPENVVPYQRMAQVKARIGEFGQASQYARQAVSLDPSDPILHGELGRMLYKNNDLGEAVKELGLAIQGGKTPDIWTVEGQKVFVTTSTVVEGEIVVGDRVRLTVVPDIDGSLIAVSITLRTASVEVSPGGSGGQQIVGVVEQIEEGVTVQGLPLDPGRERTLEFYYTYALALAKDNQCDLARNVAEMLLVGARESELAVINAEATLQICPAPLSTPGSAGTATPSP